MAEQWTYVEDAYEGLIWLRLQWETGTVDVLLILIASAVAFWLWGSSSPPPVEDACSDIDSDGEPGIPVASDTESDGEGSLDRKGLMRRIADLERALEMDRLKEEVRRAAEDGFRRGQAEVSRLAPPTAESGPARPAPAPSPPPTPPPVTPGFPDVTNNIVKDMVARLEAAEKEVAASAQSSTGATAGSAAPSTSDVPALPPPGATAAAGGQASRVGASVQEMREAMVSGKDRLLAHLGEFQEAPSWRLPGELTERVAPYLLLRLYRDHSSAKDAARDWVREKHLDKSHVAEQLKLLAAVLDSQVASDSSFINSRACELICRRIYAYQRAFADVKHRDDWKQPKGQAASKWKSKVHWDLIPEIDLETMEQSSEVIPEVEREVQKRLERKAQHHKWLEKKAREASAGQYEPEL